MGIRIFYRVIVIIMFITTSIAYFKGDKMEAIYFLGLAILFELNIIEDKISND